MAPKSMTKSSPKTSVPHRLSVPLVASAIAKLKDRGGSRYTDIHKVIAGDKKGPTFFQLKAVLVKACKEGVVRQNAQGRWLLNLAKMSTAGRPAATSDSSHSRRRRRRGRGGRSKGKGKGRGRRRRRRRGRKGRGRKGRGRRGRRRGRKGRGRKGRGRRRRRGGRRGRKGRKGR